MIPTRLHAGLVFALLLVSVAAGVQDPLLARQPPRAAQDEFVPIDQLPPDEQLPAAPLLIAAYSVAWILVAVYLWSIWRRLGRVEREIADLSRRVQPGGPSPGGGRGVR